MSSPSSSSSSSSLNVCSLIGSGAYGRVYSAFWKGRKVAVKKFSVAQTDTSRTAAIQREIEILRELADRHIIQFYGTAFHEGKLVLIMDYADGGSLERAINTRRLGDWSTKTRIAQEIARGLAYIHHEGIIHRDLKSMNVLLTRYMEVKLCDFGLATVQLQTSTMSKTPKGTFRWMAPEVLDLDPTYSTKSDMYALGMVMWEMAANCTIPFKNQADILMVITFVQTGEREKLPTDTPDDYRKWVERCWAQNPLDRPEASEMVAIDDIPGIPDEAEPDGSTLSFTTIPGVTILRSLREGNSGGGGGSKGKDDVLDRPTDDTATLRARADRDDVEAQVALASMYERGVGVEKDYQKAYEWYRRAAENGSIEAQNKTGDFFYFGRGVPKSLENAVNWKRCAARGGHSVAQRDLGRMYEYGLGVEQDHVMAVSWYRMSAEQGDMEAQSYLGTKYHDGIGVAKDYVEAVWWYRKSADLGDATIQCNLGAMLCNGQGVQQDHAEAVSWYRRSAGQGNTTAQCNLGLMLSKGLGVERDYVEAVSWYRMSAERQNAEAQFNLGWMYENGHGVPKDEKKAIGWYRKAADQGHTSARRRLVALMRPYALRHE
ncbi:hypothetical protein DFQ26_007099, partial [Actinomortierella ambigua]